MQRLVLKSIDKNLETIEKLFENCYDIIIRRMEIGELYRVKMAIVYIDGLVDKDHISNFTIECLFTEEEIKKFTLNGFKSSLLDIISKEIIANSEIKEEYRMEKAIDSILSGDAVLFIDNSDRCLIIGSKQFPARSIAEPETETVVRGPRDGFTEVLKVNTSLVRRRIKDTNLKIEIKQVGRRSKTDVAILYMDDIVDKSMLLELKERINKIDIDAVIDSSIFENLIEDNYLSPFPQIESTERPDAVAASLYSGRIAIIVDNSPFALLIPATFGTLLQSSEDYYKRWAESSFVRILRIIAVALTVLSPGLYVAITAYHPGLLPTVLTYYLAASRINVPFPAVVEAVLMELTLELLRESGTRISGPIGTTVGIVGGLIIGQAAVEAGIVSPLMIIIVAVTTISSFAIPSYDFGIGFRLWRFILIVCASILGLYGMMLGIIVMITHLIKLNSFGVPYTSPYSGLGIEGGALKDTLIKAPIQYIKSRPTFTNPQNKIRMRGYWKDGRRK